MQPLKDEKGREIRPGDVLKIFHFVGARRKRHYRYEPATAKFEIGRTGSLRWRTAARSKGWEIVQSKF